MTQVQFEEIPVEEEFCVIVEGSKKQHDETYCERRRNPNFYEISTLANLIHSSFVPLPENMDTKTWITFLRRMADAKNEYKFQANERKPWIYVIIAPYMFLLLSGFSYDNKVPPLWWFICVLTLPVPMYFILGKIGDSLDSIEKEFKALQEKIVKEKQLAFKCSGYSAEVLVSKWCGFARRYVRFAPITEIETERVNVLVKECNDLYNVQKKEAKNKPYDPSSWMSLEGQWEETNRDCIGKATHRWLFKGVESKYSFRCQHERE